MTYWKATRTDGTDFYTGTVDYAAALETGQPLPPLSGDGLFPGSGWYHLATVPTECVGMSWPCRLFEVEPGGTLTLSDAHPHKIGAESVRVIREVEPHRVFGPQGEQVVALIERSRTVSAAEVDRLGAAWAAAWDTWPTWATRYAAAMGRLAAAWVAARDAALDAARNAARVAAWDATWDGARGAAWDATRDAAGALLCRDLIGQAPGWDQDAYTLLTAPWAAVIGPAHPEDPAGAHPPSASGADSPPG